MGAVEKILKLHNQIALVDSAIAKASSVSEIARIARLEMRLRNLCSSTWNNRADRASEKAGELVAKGKTTREIVSAINKEMDKWTSDILPRFLKDFEEIYTLSRTAGWKKANKQTKASLTYNTSQIKTITKAEFPQYLPSFDLVDKEAVEALKNHQVFWIGQHYKNNVSPTIADVARKTMVETAGMDRMRASKIMQKTIREQFRHVEIPGRWSGTDRQYFEGLTANAATVSRVHGQMRSFMDLGITKYEIMNPSDSRTCEVCVHMNHKVFTVENGKQVMEGELNAKTPEQVKRVHPWVRSKELEKLSPMPGPAGPKDAASLANAGFCLPPFHFRCRCTVDISIEAGSWSGYREQTEPPRVQPAKGKPKQPKPKPGRPANFPEMSQTPTTPMAPFNASRLMKAFRTNEPGSVKLTPKAQKIVRQELNALCAEEGMIAHDAQARRKFASKFDVKTAREISVEQPGAAAWHTHDGLIVCSDDQISRSIRVLKDVARGDTPFTTSGFRTVLHETIHAQSAKNFKAVFYVGRVIEEGTTELATIKILNKRFGNKWTRGYSYRMFVDGISETVDNAMKKVLGEKYRDAYNEFSRKHRTHGPLGSRNWAGHEIASQASIKMRRLRKRTSSYKVHTRNFTDSIELPSEVTAGMPASELEKLTKKVRKEIFRELWGPRDNALDGARGKLGKLYKEFYRD